MGDLYRQKSGKHHKDGKVYLPGDLVELTPQEAIAFANKFEKVETVPVQAEGETVPVQAEGETTPPDGGKKGK